MSACAFTYRSSGPKNVYCIYICISVYMIKSAHIVYIYINFFQACSLWSSQHRKACLKNGKTGRAWHSGRNPGLLEPFISCKHLLSARVRARERNIASIGLAVGYVASKQLALAMAPKWCEVVDGVGVNHQTTSELVIGWDLGHWRFLCQRLEAEFRDQRQWTRNPSEAVREWIFGLTLESPEIASCYSEPLANHLKTNSPNGGQDCFQKNSHLWEIWSKHL